MSRRIVASGRRPPSLRAVLGLALATFLVVGAPGVASASWSTNALTSSATVASGTLDLNQTGFAALAVNYTPALRVDTGAVTVSNPGTVAVPYTHTIIAATATTLSNNTILRVWPVASAGACTATATIPANTASQTFTVGWTRSGTLPAGASSVLCVRTTVTTTGVALSVGTATRAESRLDAGIGNWSDDSIDTAVQAVLDLVPPSRPTGLIASNTTSTSTTLTWTASTDNVAVVAYDIYRDGVLVGTSPTTNFTATGITRASTGSYTVRARDAAGNASTSSAAVTVTTPAVDPGTPYLLGNPRSGLCLDGGIAPAEAFDTVQLWQCGAARVQQFQFVAAFDGYFTIAARDYPTIVMDVKDEATANNIPIILYPRHGYDNQLFQVVPQTGGTFLLIAKNSGKCLEAQGAATAQGTPIVQDTCSGGTEQSFTVTPAP